MKAQEVKWGRGEETKEKEQEKEGVGAEQEEM